MARVDSPGIRFLTLRSREALPHYDESTQTSTTRLYLAMHPPSNSRNSAFSLHIWVSLFLTSSGWISPSVVSEHFWAFGSMAMNSQGLGFSPELHITFQQLSVMGFWSTWSCKLQIWLIRAGEETLESTNLSHHPNSCLLQSLLGPERRKSHP